MPQKRLTRNLLPRGASPARIGAAWCGAVTIVVLLGNASPVHAVCNVIPGTTRSFTSTVGTTDRPFASPGDWVKLTLDLDPACHVASPGFSTTAAAQVVTVVFQPLQGPRHVVILATDCEAEALKSAKKACESRSDVATATCIPANRAGEPLDLKVPATDELRFRFPDTDKLFRLCTGGLNDGLPCTNESVCGGGGTCSGGVEDDLTLSGPAAFAVTPAGAALPCGLASESCASQSGLLACVDAFFTSEGKPCSTAPHDVFAHFTALPPPNDYHALCTEPDPPCTGAVNDVRFALDTAGTILLPVDWRGVLVNQDVPVARLLRGSTMVEAFEGSGQPIRIPDNTFLASYTPDGAKVPPIFDPQVDPTSPDAATLFGTADAPQSVLRIARRSPGALACEGGDRGGQPCATTGECPGGTCGVATCVGGPNARTTCVGDSECPGGACREGLFDFGTRVLPEGGPVLLRLGTCLGGTTPLDVCTVLGDCPEGQCSEFEALALDPVPLDGLNQSAETNAFVVSEALDDSDLNEDGDQTDDVVEFFDRATGVIQPIGHASTKGRAVVRIHETPFSFPAVAVENDVLAFIESESAEGNIDTNQDFDSFDGILRVFRLPAIEVTERITPPRVVDAAPLVSGRSLAVSNGLVFYRRSEAGQARQTTERIGKDGLLAGPSEPSLSADGRYVAFSAVFIDMGSPVNFEVFVRDRRSDTTTRVSVPSGGGQADDASTTPAISADGRYVAFTGYATNLVPGDNNTFCEFADRLIHNCPDVFVHDRDADGNGIFDEVGGVTTTRVSVATGGGEANNISFNPAISADGRFVAFESQASNLVPDDTNGGSDSETDIFVHDRETGSTTRVSVPTGGGQATGGARKPRSQRPHISASGRYIVFDSDATNFVPDDTNQQIDVFVHDQQTHKTERVSVSTGGGEANSQSSDASISADGRYVAFGSRATNLVAGDTNGASDVYVRDREEGTTTRVSVSTGGQQAGEGLLGSSTADISGDGRYIAFPSLATNLVPDDTNGTWDIFVHDRLTRTTTRVSVSNAGAEQANSASGEPSISADGRYVAFTSDASNLAPDPLAGGCATSCVFVRGPDSDDLASDVFRDGQLHDSVLEFVDASVDASTVKPTTLCPAADVAIAGGNAAFLRPESLVPDPALWKCKCSHDPSETLGVQG